MKTKNTTTAATPRTAADLARVLSVPEMRTRTWKLAPGIKGETMPNGYELETRGGKLETWNGTTAKVVWGWDTGRATANCHTSTRNLADLIEA